MSDRELLELAAKAAGMTLGAWSDQRLAFMYRDVSPGPGYWNPLTNDGDALRLAVKLRLTTDTSDGMLDGNKYTPATRIDASSGRMLLIELHGADPYAATRRAIVRAAAEIGRTL